MSKNKNVLTSVLPRSQLGLIVQKLTRIERKLESMDKREEEEEQKLEQKENEIIFEEKKIEKVLFRMGNLTFRRKHLLEVIRAGAGAFLGVSLGRSLIDLHTLAQKLPWENILAILLFILLVSGLLIYKNEHSFVKKTSKLVILQKLASMYLIAVVIEFFSLALFNALPTDFETLVKTLIIGSYAAMAGAVSFSLV